MVPAAAFAGAVLLSACSADTLDGGGDTPVVPPGSETVSSGTVTFSNNTSMTIGNGIGSRTTRLPWMTRGASFDFEGNNACTLDMPTQPELTGEEEKLMEGGNLGSIGVKSVISSGVTYSLDGDNGKYINNDLFVQGTLTLNTYVFEYAYKENQNPTGRIIVLEGGTLNINDLKGHAIEDVQILNYGGTVNINAASVTLEGSAALMTNGSINAANTAFALNGAGSRLYVGGDLTCKSIASEGSDALVHVIGNLTAVPNITEAGKYQEDGSGQVNASSSSNVCIEGVTDVYRLIASSSAKVHTDCKLLATDEKSSAINITNGAVLCSSYVKAGTLHVSGGGSGATAYVYLSDGGVMDISNQLSVGNAKILPYNSGKAIVSASIIYIEDQTSWDNIFDPTLYINYETVDPENAKPENTELHNVAEIGSATECSPGFTVPEDPGTDPEEPETPATGGDIDLGIDLGITEDYTLKADDFAIRINGEYIEDGFHVEGNTATLGNIKITEDDLHVTVSGLSYDNILDGNDYTYEVWLWINNSKLLQDGTGGYGPLFDTDAYLRWIGKEGASLPLDYQSPEYEPGVDITKDYVTVTSPAGYTVRYNVYRGLSGHINTATGLGDTPYVKVSIHVQKDVNAGADTVVPIY